jgi:lysophospholipase L1-like esterase
MSKLGRLLIAAVGASLLLQVAASAAPHAASENWIGTWGYVSLPPPPGAPIPAAAAPPPPGPTPLGVFTAPAPAPPFRPAGPPAAIDNPGNVPVDTTTTDLGNVTVRQVVRVSQGGTRLRLRFSNENSADALPLAAVHVGAAGVDGAVVPGSDHVVTFDGQPSVILPAGAPVLSDPIELPTRALEKLYISSYLPGPVPTRAPRTLFQYVAGKSGDFTAAASLPGVRLMRISPYVTLVEVQAAAPTGVVVALGDSITQGSASTANAFRSWPDRLAERLATQHWAVVNAGIGGNRLLRYGLGPSALSRLDRDVLSVPGLKVIILLEGINDIGVGLGTLTSVEPVTADALESADRQIITRAHEHGVRVIGATLTPYQGAGYASPAGEMVREALNHWIRSSGAFDGVIDFAPVVADQNNPLTFDRRYNDTDHLHPNDAGYKVMGDSMDLSVIVK